MRLVLLLTLVSSLFAEETKNILFLAGNPSHSSGDHEFRAGCMLLADKLNASGLAIKASVHSYGWPEDESIFDDVDACVIYADAAGRFGDKYAFLDEKVKAGMGIMFMHYGVHPSQPVGEQYFMPWIGGYMETGWSVNPHWIAELKPVEGEQIGRGIPHFQAFDEFYYNMRFPTQEEDPSSKPLVMATPEPKRMVRYINLWNQNGVDNFNKPQALMWGRDPESGGRGVGFVGGHYHRNWAIDSFRQLVMNAIVWSARVDVPEAGVPAGTVTVDELNANLDKKKNMIRVELPTDELLNQPPMPLPDLSKKKGK